VFILQQNYRLAIEEINRILATYAVPKGTGEHLLLLADRALSLAAIGDRNEAVSQIAAASGCELDVLSPDDAALVGWSLFQAKSIIEDDVSAGRFLVLAQAKLKQHQSSVGDLLTGISAYSDF